ncbi:MAG: hypothetical protein ACUVQR_06765 [Thermogutta sp.]
MKKERRQELKENELAEILAKWYAQIAPHSQKILIGAIVILIVYLGWSIWTRWAKAVENEAWESLHAAMESGVAADYEAVAEKFSNTDAAHWAGLLAADTHLQIGCRQILTNKADGAQELRKALDGYLSLRSVKVSPFFEQRVLWGLGRAYEALSGTREGQGELDRALAAYRELVERWPDGPFSSLAKRRLTLLEKAETREFYDALAAYEPAKPMTEPLPGQLEFGPTGVPTPPKQSTGDQNASTPMELDSSGITQPNNQAKEEASPAEPHAQNTEESMPSTGSQEQGPQPANPANPSGEEASKEGRAS